MLSKMMKAHDTCDNNSVGDKAINYLTLPICSILIAMIQSTDINNVTTNNFLVTITVVIINITIIVCNNL